MGSKMMMSNVFRHSASIPLRSSMHEEPLSAYLIPEDLHNANLTYLIIPF